MKKNNSSIFVQKRILISLQYSVNYGKRKKIVLNKKWETIRNKNKRRLMSSHPKSLKSNLMMLMLCLPYIRKKVESKILEWLRFWGMQKHNISSDYICWTFISLRLFGKRQSKLSKEKLPIRIRLWHGSRMQLSKVIPMPKEC